jgi:hypothetical protein
MLLPISEKLFGDDFRYKGYFVITSEALYTNVFLKTI